MRVTAFRNKMMTASRLRGTGQWTNEWTKRAAGVEGPGVSWMRVLRNRHGVSSGLAAEEVAPGQTDGCARFKDATERFSFEETKPVLQRY